MTFTPKEVILGATVPPKTCSTKCGGEYRRRREEVAR